MPRLFGEKVRLLRTRQGLTQAELATWLHLASHSHVSYLERGKSAPSIEVVVTLANALQIPLDYLLNDRVPASPLPSQITTPLATSSFGEQLRRFRQQHGWTQTELANELTPRTQAYISYLEAGQKLPSVDVALQLAAILGHPIESFFRLDAETNL